MSTIALSATFRDRMIRHAASEAPREACGLVAVLDDTVTAVYEIQNIAESNDRFLLEPRAQFAAIQAADAACWEIGGIYHSHPHGPDSLSETDLAAPVDASWVSFLVVPSDGEWEVRAFDAGSGASIVIEESTEHAELR